MMNKNIDEEGREREESEMGWNTRYIASRGATTVTRETRLLGGVQTEQLAIS